MKSKFFSVKKYMKKFRIFVKLTYFSGKEKKKFLVTLAVIKEEGTYIQTCKVLVQPSCSQFDQHFMISFAAL